MPTNAELANQMSELLDKWQTYIDQQRARETGTIDGGPNSNGYYPITDPAGITTNQPSPARMAYEARLLNIVDLTGSNNVSVSVGDSGKIFRTFNANNAMTVTLPRDAPLNWHCMFIQFGTGRLTFTIGAGGTLQNDQGIFRSRSQGSLVTAICSNNPTGSNNSTIVLGGSLAA